MSTLQDHFPIGLPALLVPLVWCSLRSRSAVPIALQAIKNRWSKEKELVGDFLCFPLDVAFHFLTYCNVTGGIFRYIGYIGMCSPKVYGFSAVLAINRISSLVILVSNRVWFLYSSLELAMTLEEVTVWLFSTRLSTKALQTSCLGQLCEKQWS